MIKLTFGRRDLLVSKFKAGIVIGILWLAILSGAGFLVFLGLDSYDKAHDRLSDQATSYAHLIAEHDRVGFSIADVILRDMLDFLTWDDFNGTMTPERRSKVLGYLRAHRDRLPGIASFTLVGADGIRRIGVVGKDFTNLSDRGYFQACRDGRDFYISNVEDGRASGRPGIHVARRVPAPDGTFGGVILINLSADDVFVPFYKSLNLGKGYGTTLRDPQRILIGYPKYTISAAPLKQRDKLGDRLAAGDDRGVLLTTDPADGLEKLTAFERLEGTNIFATASLPTGEAMAEARKLALGALLSALACILGAMGATSALAKAHALAKAREAAAKADRERQMLIRQLQTVAEEERRSISHEIHDVLNAIVVRVRIDAQGILTLTSQAKLDAVLEEIARRASSITQHANDLYAQGRALVKRLRPENPRRAGARPGRRRNGSRLRRRSSDMSLLVPVFRRNGELGKRRVDRSLPSRAGGAVERGEARKGLGGQCVAHTRSRKQHAEDRVEDDGQGFDGTAPTAGIGLVGMRERVAAFNGHLEIQSSAKTGTRLVASIPLHKAADTDVAAK
jgi:hypothetical protein